MCAKGRLLSCKRCQRQVVAVRSCDRGHEYCSMSVADFWQEKFEVNIARDSAVRAALLDAGWRVATIWEYALRKPEQVTVVSPTCSQLGCSPKRTRSRSVNAKFRP